MRKHPGKILAVALTAVLVLALGGGAQSSEVPRYTTGLTVDELYEKAKVPRVSVMNSYMISIANNTPHPHAAELLARWAMGEIDGNAAGLEPFNTDGVWVPRPDVENKNDRTIDTVKAWELDQSFFDSNFRKFTNFWLSKVF